MVPPPRRARKDVVRMEVRKADADALAGLAVLEALKEKMKGR